MFTGIVTDMGTVESVQKKGDTRFVIRTSYPVGTIAIGASIACSGACMTVVEKGDGWFAIDVSAESLRCTNLGKWKAGSNINLERSLRMGDELGGHMVTGHVDGLGSVQSIEPVGDSHKLVFRVPEGLKHFIAEKGSIAVEGVSLTVNGVDNNLFWVNLIPHTWHNTTLGALQVGDEVNVEIDLIARYITRQVEARKLG